MSDVAIYPGIYCSTSSGWLICTKSSVWQCQTLQYIKGYIALPVVADLLFYSIGSKKMTRRVKTFWFGNFVCNGYDKEHEKNNLMKITFVRNCCQQLKWRIWYYCQCFVVSFKWYENKIL